MVPVYRVALADRGCILAGRGILLAQFQFLRVRLLTLSTFLGALAVSPMSILGTRVVLLQNPPLSIPLSKAVLGVGRGSAKLWL